MTQVRMICIDLDGTLLNDDHHTVSAENLDAIVQAAGAGVLIVPATGRIYGRIPEEVHRAAGIRYAIVANGAEVIAVPGGQRLHTAYLPVQDVLPVVDWAQKQGYTPEVYQCDRMLIQTDDLERLAKTGMEPEHLQYLRQHETPVDDLQAYLRQKPGEICKINLPYFENEAERAALRARLESTGRFSVASSMDRNLEIGSPVASKGSAIAALCGQLGIDIEQVMAIGDGDNDREMLSAVGLPVAMGNAQQQIKALAAYVTATNEQAGVAKAILAALKGELK